MDIDDRAVALFFRYVDGDQSLGLVWDHPAYDVVRKHATLLNRNLTKRDLEAAVEGAETTFQGVRNLSANRQAIMKLRDHIRTNKEAWLSTIREALERITPDADLVELTIYLAIGYEFGIGLREGAYLNLNEPLFHEDPRQALYTAIHESSHVVYDGIHEFSETLGPQLLQTVEGRKRFFEVLFHTEAYATFTPLAVRRDGGDLGVHDHPVSEDYRVIDDKARLGDLVDRYDAFRRRLADGEAGTQAVFSHVWGEHRLPYRVGTVMLERAARQSGMDMVRSGFKSDPGRFLAEFDQYLDPYRK